MIVLGSTVLKRRPYKPDVRIGIEHIRAGDLIKTVTTDNGDFSYNYVDSIVKLVLPKYEVVTSALDTIICTDRCKFFTLDGLRLPWNPSFTFDKTTRFLKRPLKKGTFCLPFVKKVTELKFTAVFFDLVMRYEGHAVLVNDYAKIYDANQKSNMKRIDEVV